MVIWDSQKHVQHLNMHFWLSIFPEFQISSENDPRADTTSDLWNVISEALPRNHAESKGSTWIYMDLHHVTNIFGIIQKHRASWDIHVDSTSISGNRMFSFGWYSTRFHTDPPVTKRGFSSAISGNPRSSPRWMVSCYFCTYPDWKLLWKNDCSWLKDDGDLMDDPAIFHHWWNVPQFSYSDPAMMHQAIYVCLQNGMFPFSESMVLKIIALKHMSFCPWIQIEWWFPSIYQWNHINYIQLFHHFSINFHLQ